ncbi:hypothetical protein POM88_006863 [Heracleum sosnowskyi]|uniref:Uncharacterized protein n=1 Tax=Heracleum sosnowskyi TaxID=360622 RepID=A0AAD8J751_9APIA|nr:hypothetical protein POM88_006863 [Heracleum sosnowskyi]
MELAFASKKKENWNEGDIKALYINQVQLLSEVRQKLFSAESKLSTAKTNAFFLKIEREELTSALLKLTAETNTDYLKLEREERTSALLKLTEELSMEEERVKTLTLERDQCHDAQSVVETELLKMEAEKEEAHVTFKVINDRYDAAKKEFDRKSNHILMLVRKYWDIFTFYLT